MAQIILRSAIRFVDARLGSGPNWLDALISVPGLIPQKRILLEPVRHRRSDQAEEWFVHSDEDELNVQVFPRLQWFAIPLGGFPTFTLEEPLRLTVAELEPEQGRERYQITGGALTLPLGQLGNTAWARNIAQMWPTGAAGDISHLRLEPAGAHLQGVLPAGFYPDRQIVPVVLRLPRREDDYVPEDDANRPELAGRHIWRMPSTRSHPSRRPPGRSSPAGPACSARSESAVRR
ncbi:MAG: hypothetical protein BGO49_27385 [Planctomycetales bacterium 71-10]|nr:MAG: hypothetical protein BGO49_27385 [Planctomycetales bacterium 71-10]